MSKWLPISTAPHGVGILVTDGELVTVVEIGECSGLPWLYQHGWSGYEWSFDIEYKDLTHWMPLPMPPEAT